MNNHTENTSRVIPAEDIYFLASLIAGVTVAVCTVLIELCLEDIDTLFWC